MIYVSRMLSGSVGERGVKKSDQAIQGRTPVMTGVRSGSQDASLLTIVS
jgi:hypothetical protein